MLNKKSALLLKKRSKLYQKQHKERIISKGDMYHIKRVSMYLRPYIWRFIFNLVLTSISMAVFSIEPYLTGLLIDEFSKSEPQFSNVVFISTSFFVLLVGALFLSYFSGMSIQKVGQDVIEDIRRDSFAKVENLSIAQINSMPVGKFVTRVTGDTDGLMELFTNILVNLIRNIVLLISVTVIVLTMNVILGLILIGFLPLVFISVVVFRKYSKKSYEEIREQVSSMNAFLSENISGMKTTQIFNQEERKANEFISVNSKLEGANRRSMYIFAIFRPLMYFLYIMATISIFALGVPFVWQGVIGLGTLISFVSYISFFFNPIQQLAEQFNGLQSSLAAARKVVSILDMKVDFLDKSDALDIGKFEGKIEFRHVWFSYIPGEWILRDVSFTIEKGETAAFVGATGAGKSTIIGLIVRNYEVQKGEVLIDNINVNDIKLDCLRKNIGEMLQDVFIFSGTVSSNISLRDENVSKQEMIAASEYVGANTFIEKLTNGYEEEVRERGNNFSMGQRQLLSFARTVAYKPSIMVLDEATANIDTETEVLIQESLKKMANIGTMVIVAHRLSTIQHANKIFVLQKGVIVEAGAHQELLQLRGQYYNLYCLQYEERKIEEEDKNED